MKRAELPILGWKGGVDPEVKKQKKKAGTHLYLAQWQGLGGQDLCVDTEEEISLTCSLTGVIVTYTNSPEDWW